MQKIVPSLWLKNQVEEAMNFYTSVFKHSKILSVTRTGPAGPGPEGTVLAASFEINGMEFIAINGNNQSTFNESVSFTINCLSQDEIDYYWNILTADGGEESMCGWLKDKFGLSWQVVPPILIKMLQDEDTEKAGQVMNAMIKMRKIDMATIEKAYKG